MPKGQNHKSSLNLQLAFALQTTSSAYL